MRDHKIQLKIRPSESENCPNHWAPFHIDLGCFDNYGGYDHKYGADGKWKYSPNEIFEKLDKFRVVSKKSMKTKSKLLAYTPNFLELKYPFFDINGNILYRADGMRNANFIRDNSFFGFMRREMIWDLNILKVYLSQITKYQKLDENHDLPLLECIEKKVLMTFGSIFSTELVKVSLEDITEVEGIW